MRGAVLSLFFVLGTAVAQAQPQAPSVASDGIDFVALSVDDSVTATGISRAGILLRQEQLGAVSAPTNTAIAFGSSMYLAVWTDRSGVFARRLSGSGVALDSSPITIRRFPSVLLSSAAVAWNGSSFFVVWSEGEIAIYGSIVGQDGSVSHSLVIPAGVEQPEVAWNGRIFLVVGGLFDGSCGFGCFPRRIKTGVVRVAADGRPIDTTPLVIDSASFHATVASDGRNFAVALDGHNDVSILPVSDTLLVGSRQKVFQWFDWIRSDIAWDGSNYVVACRYWMRYFGPNPNQLWLAVFRISPNGVADTGVVTTTVFVDPLPLSIAVNHLGETLSMVGETSVGFYFDSQMQPMPSPPPPPRSVVALGTPTNFVLHWESASIDTVGIVVEFRSFTVGVALAEKMFLTFSGAAYDFLDVRAFNAGGMSEPVTAVVQVPPRRRPFR